MCEESDEIIRYVKGVREYREFKIRTYVHSINDALKQNIQLDMGARLCILINYFRAGKWCDDCLSFVVSQFQDDIMMPKDENLFHTRFIFVQSVLILPKIISIIYNFIHNIFYK